MNYTPSPRLASLLQCVAIVSASFIANQAAAEQVTLKSSDGTVNLVGDLVSFSDDNYLIRTDLGDLRIAANRVFCEGPGCPVVATASSDVKLAGSDTIGNGLMPLMMGGYATFLNAEGKTENTATEGEFTTSFIGDQGFGDAIGTYLVSATRSGDAFTSLLDKSAQIGMSSRRITPDEARALKEAGAGNMIDPTQEHILAVDSLVVIVNQENPLSEISIENLGKIYSGKITNWSELGGPDLPIKVVAHAEDSGTSSVFREAVYSGKEAPLAQGAVIADDNDAAAAAVNDDPAAISYVGYAFQRGQKALTLISDCGIPTSADPFSVKTEEYAMFRRLYLYNRGDLDNELAKQFLAFTTSDEANNVIRQAGFIDLGIETREQGPDTDRYKRLASMEMKPYEKKIVDEMLEEMNTFDRLSATFRFRTGSSQLDPRGLIDLTTLANYLEAMPQGTIVRFIGFSDDVGEFEPNIGLSKGRAEAVAKELQKLGGDRLAHITFDTDGHGEVSPAACNTNELGRSINRRVETWISMP